MPCRAARASASQVKQWTCAQRAATGEESSDSLDASAKDPTSRTSGVLRAPFDVEALRQEQVKGTYLQERYFYVDSLEHALHIVRYAATQHILRTTGTNTRTLYRVLRICCTRTCMLMLACSELAKQVTSKRAHDVHVEPRLELRPKSILADSK